MASRSAARRAIEEAHRTFDQQKLGAPYSGAGAQFRMADGGNFLVYDVNWNDGTGNVNLRGLGAGRTLVLINGKRQTFSPFPIGEQAQLFVDTNMIPSAAIGRVEVLKDGAAALYGSDAIAGVVNFITRSDLEGFEVSGSYQTFEGTDGEYDISAAYGLQGDNWNWVTSVGYQFRSETPLLEKDWAILPFSENPVGGFSTIGNPGSFVALGNIGPGVAAAGTPLAFANSDDQCSTLGGVDGGVLCRFQFTGTRQQSVQLGAHLTGDIATGQNVDDGVDEKSGNQDPEEGIEAVITGSRVKIGQSAVRDGHRTSACNHISRDGGQDDRQDRE